MIGAGGAKFSATQIQGSTIKFSGGLEFFCRLIYLFHTHDYPRYVFQLSMAKNYLFCFQFEACCEFNVRTYAVDLTIRTKLFLFHSPFSKICLFHQFPNKSIFISKKFQPPPVF